jgi:hypothetical protein
LGGGENNNRWGSSFEELSSLLLHVPPSLPRLLLMLLLEGLRRNKVNSTAAHRRATGILDLIQIDLLPQILTGIEIRKKSSFTIYIIL